MNVRKLLTRAALPLALMVSVAHADDDVTMSVIEEGESVDRILAPIELPPVAAEEGAINSEKGRSTADDARSQGREFGEATSNEARERGEQARESAAENAENARDRVKDDIGRDALENLPDEVRDNIPDDVRERGRDNLPPRGNGG